MVVRRLPVAMISSASARLSESVKPPSISRASVGPTISTGARKKPFGPAGKCYHVRTVAAVRRIQGRLGEHGTYGVTSTDYTAHSKCADRRALREASNEWTSLSRVRRTSGTDRRQRREHSNCNQELRSHVAPGPGVLGSRP